MRELSERRINQLEKAYYERFPKFHKSIEYFFKDIRNSILTVRKKGFLFKKIYGKIIVNILTTDLILNIIYNLEKYPYKKITDFKEVDINNIVRQSEILYEDDQNFKRILKDLIHNSDKVKDMNQKGSNTIKKLFNLYLEHPEELPDNVIKHFYVDFTFGINQPIDFYTYELRDDFLMNYEISKKSNNSRKI